MGLIQASQVLSVLLPEVLQVLSQLLVLELGLKRRVLLLKSSYFRVKPGNLDALDFKLFS